MPVASHPEMSEHYLGDVPEVTCAGVTSICDRMHVR